MEKRTIEVKNTDKSVRLDLYLTFHNNDLTRSAIKQLIIKGNIEINGVKGAHAAYKVKPGDKIILFVDEEFKTSVIPEDIPLDIIFEDKDYLVVNKPYGMVVHPASGNWSGTLANAVLNKINSEGMDSSRPGIVHRLDRETSGVIIIAKNNESLWWLTRQFAERKVQKEYIALAFGNIQIKKLITQKFLDVKVHKIHDDSFTVESGLARSKINRKLMSVDRNGKESLTLFTPLQDFVMTANLQKLPFTLLEVNPKTGRTHQIRVHLKALGFPIWGDSLYMSRKQFNMVNDISKMRKLSNRLFLHAQKITFIDQNGKERSFEAELPEDLKEIIS